jgi:LysR family transcriptional activator of nhaA
MLNYKHLHYFWIVAREGGIARASERLHLTPQSISGQLGLLEDQLGTKLFTRVGRNLEISETGRLALSYADEIFSLGGELEEVIHQIAHRILQPALTIPEPVRMICREASLDDLLAELTLHRLDLVLADRPIPATVSTRGYSHKLGVCGVSFLATSELVQKLAGDFPQCLDGAPMLLPGASTQLRSVIDQWLDKHRIHPQTVAEFDDSALMKAFGKQGAGGFIAPAAIEKEVMLQYGVESIGQVDEITEEFYAISVERRVLHPVVTAIMDSAREKLFI